MIRTRSSPRCSVSVIVSSGVSARSDAPPTEASAHVVGASSTLGTFGRRVGGVVALADRSVLLSVRFDEADHRRLGWLLPPAASRRRASRWTVASSVARSSSVVAGWLIVRRGWRCGDGRRLPVRRCLVSGLRIASTLQEVGRVPYLPSSGSISRRSHSWKPSPMRFNSRVRAPGPPRKSGSFSGPRITRASRRITTISLPDRLNTRPQSTVLPSSGVVQQRLLSLLDQPIVFAHRGAKGARQGEHPGGVRARAADSARRGWKATCWLTGDGVPVLDHDGVYRSAGAVAARLSMYGREELPAHIPSLVDLIETAGSGTTCRSILQQRERAVNRHRRGHGHGPAAAPSAGCATRRRVAGGVASADDTRAIRRPARPHAGGPPSGGPPARRSWHRRGEPAPHPVVGRADDAVPPYSTGWRSPGTCSSSTSSATRCGWASTACTAITSTSWSTPSRRARQGRSASRLFRQGPELKRRSGARFSRTDATAPRRGV